VKKGVRIKKNQKQIESPNHPKEIDRSTRGKQGRKLLPRREKSSEKNPEGPKSQGVVGKKAG